MHCVPGERCGTLNRDAARHVDTNVTQKRHFQNPALRIQNRSAMRTWRATRHTLIATRHATSLQTPPKTSLSKSCIAHPESRRDAYLESDAMPLNRDAARHVATNATAPTIDRRRAGRDGHGYTHDGDGGWELGGGIFAKTAKTPPLQSGIAGRLWRAAPRPKLHRTITLPTPIHRPSFALPTPYLGRCTLGFCDEIRGCSGPGRELDGSW